MATTESTTIMVNLWQQTLKALKDEIDRESFGAWLEPIHPENYIDGRLTLGVPSDLFRTWLTANYEEQIKRQFGRLVGREIWIEYWVEPDEPAKPWRKDGRSARGGRRADAVEAWQGVLQSTDLKPVPLNPDYTFDRFIVGESNRFANAAAMAVAEPGSKVYNPLFIYGGVGLGKTHLMHAIGHQMLAYGPHQNVLYVSSEAFMNAFIEAIKYKNPTHFRNCFRSVDLLLVDDIQFFAGAERSQTEFFHTFNALYEAGKKIVICSDQPPKELTELELRLRSRFEAGLIVDIQPPDLETRVAILQNKAEQHGLDLDQEVAIFIAERIRTNIRELEGALTKLGARHLVGNEPITIDIARELLGEFIGGQEPLKVSIDKIQIVVCNFFNISSHDLTGSRRLQKFVGPRHIACYLAREMTEHSYPEIARKFGGRNHTSIIYSHRRVKTKISKDLQMSNLITHLIKEIKEDESFSHKTV